MAPAPIIRIERLTKRFGRKEVLRGVSLDIFEAEVFGLLGANGAGKSTIIKIVTNQTRADDGAVEIGGQPPSGETNRMIGLAPQEIAVYPQLSVRENLAFFARAYGLTGAQVRRNVNRTLDEVHLRSIGGQRAATLSGGWRRRLNLAVALVHDPRIGVLDEPTAGMDIEARQQTWEVMRGLRSREVTVVLTTHLMDEAEAVCDRIGILHEGRIAALGTLAELRTIVPAVELAEVESADSSALQRRAAAAGFATRVYAGRLTLLMQERLAIAEIIARLAPIEIRSIRLRSISLGDVYLEVVTGCGSRALAPGRRARWWSSTDGSHCPRRDSRPRIS